MNPTRPLALLAAAGVLLAACTSPPPAHTPEEHASPTAAPPAAHTAALPAPALPSATAEPAQPSPPPAPQEAAGPAPSTTPEPTPAQDGASANEVAVAAVVAMWTMDTTTDTSPLDAQRRAATWLAPNLAAATEQTETISGGAWWTELAAHRGTTTVDAHLATEAGQPPDTTTLAYRSIAATITPTGTDGWHGQPWIVTTRLVLARPDQTRPWQITDMSTS